MGTLQASGTPIDKLFYILLAGSVILTIVGLILLIHPFPRKINMDAHFLTKPDLEITEKENKKSDQSLDMVRPPRLNIALPNNYMVAKSDNIKIDTTDYTDELNKIFTDAGYVLKSAPIILNIKTILFAIGSDEALWIGAQNVSDTDFENIINRIDDIFSETLEDIKITINPFIIDNNKTSNKIKVYKSVGDLQAELPENRKLSDTEQEDFEAFSEYIDTVSDYLKKL